MLTRNVKKVSELTSLKGKTLMKVFFILSNIPSNQESDPFTKAWNDWS